MINAVTDGLIGVGDIQPMQTVQVVNIGVELDVVNIGITIEDINVNLKIEGGGGA